jgi:hypothetical protein
MLLARENRCALTNFIFVSHSFFFECFNHDLHSSLTHRKKGKKSQPKKSLSYFQCSIEHKPKFHLTMDHKFLRRECKRRQSSRSSEGRKSWYKSWRCQNEKQVFMFTEIRKNCRALNDKVEERFFSSSLLSVCVCKNLWHWNLDKFFVFCCCLLLSYLLDAVSYASSLRFVFFFSVLLGFCWISSCLFSSVSTQLKWF